MKAIFIPDCDCEHWPAIGCTSDDGRYCSKIDKYSTDAEAIKAYWAADGQCMAHGPSGHLISVIDYDNSGEPFVPIRHQPDLKFAICQGPDDICCGQCRYSIHGCAPRAP